MIIQAKRSSGR